MIRTNKLRTVTDEKARIEIFSPVLKSSPTKWRGFYEDTLISFEMKDYKFRSEVVSGNISFTSGDVFICVLEMHRELNEAGEIVVKNYVVTNVLDKDRDGQLQETRSGKNYRRNKREARNQGAFDF